MGWNMLIMLHLICAMAAMVGVHSENDPTAVLTPQYQAFEGDAVHSMMQSWVEAGTNPDLFNSSRWDWSFEAHPCNQSRSGDSNAGHWYGISCSTMPEDSNLVQNRSLVGLELDNDDSDSMLQLVGELPPALVNLTNLRTLSISNISTLFGPLPAGLFCSSQVLRYMKLSGCSFNGSISSGFDSDCHQNYGLEYLDLSRNSFTEMSPISSNIDTYIDKYYSNLQYLNCQQQPNKRRVCHLDQFSRSC